MAANAKPDAIDTDLVRKLADILTETNLTEIEVERGELKIRVARGGGSPMTFTVPLGPVAYAPDPGAPVRHDLPTTPSPGPAAVAPAATGDSSADSTSGSGAGGGGGGPGARSAGDGAGGCWGASFGAAASASILWPAASSFVRMSSLLPAFMNASSGSTRPAWTCSSSTSFSSFIPSRPPI